MASFIVAAILLLTACATFHSLYARGIPLSSYVFNPDNDVYAKEHTAVPANHIKVCDSPDKHGGTPARKDDSKVGTHVGPQRIIEEVRKSSDSQMPDEMGENAISRGRNPDRTQSQLSRECASMQDPVVPPMYDRESKAFRTHILICQTLNYVPCIVGDIDSFVFKDDRFGDRRFNITVNKGMIFGLAKFAHEYILEQNNLKLHIRWRNILLHFSLTIDERGKEDVKSFDAYFALEMILHFANETVRQIELSGAKGLDFKSQNSENPSVVYDWAYENITRSISAFINIDLRSFMYYSVFDAVDGNGQSNRAPFCQGLEKAMSIRKKSNIYPFYKESGLKVRMK